LATKTVATKTVATTKTISIRNHIL